MAKIHGVAGEWARVKGMVTGLWPLFLGVFVAGFAVAATVFANVVWGLALLAASVVYSGWSLSKGLRHAERFFKGARGEERVSGILTRLPESYHVFNDFVAGGKHVDHVVAGPAGVFAVETAQLVKASLAAAGWNGSVTPVLAFASDTFRQHIAELHGAVVINSCELAKSFATEKVVIPPAELERLVALMESNS